MSATAILKSLGASPRETRRAAIGDTPRINRLDRKRRR
jgi:hypothetical protein